MHACSSLRYLATFALISSTIPLVLLGVSIDVCAVELRPGDLVVPAGIGAEADDNFGLLRIDPLTGDRTIISDNSRGTGPELDLSLGVSGVTRRSDGTLLVAAQNGVFTVDPSTGDRTLLSPGSSTSVVTVGDRIFIGGSECISEVDPISGARIVLTPDIWQAFSLTHSGGDIYLVGWNAIQRYTIETGATETFDYGGMAITADSDGTLLITGLPSIVLGLPGVFRVDLTQHFPYDLQTISTYNVGAGPLMEWEPGIAVGLAGNLWVSCYPHVAAGGQTRGVLGILSIDPTTGDRTVFSDATHGAGPNFYLPSGIFVVPAVPEPSTIVLATLGVAALLVRRFRRPRGTTRARAHSNE